jgi:AmmeMemoRadiSam system protein A
MSDTQQTPGSWPAYARLIIEQAIRENDPKTIKPPPSGSQPFGGAFVTLRLFGGLRGCMGTLDTDQPLADAVRYAAVNAAVHDPRFAPLTLAELPEVTIEVSVMSPLWPMGNLDELELGQHGIIVRSGARRGLFLPQVVTEHHFDKEAFLTRCCSEKAGLKPDAWRDRTTEVLLFTTDVYSDADDEP